MLKTPKLHSEGITLREHHMLQNNSKTAERQKSSSYIFTQNSHFLFTMSTFYKQISNQPRRSVTHTNTHLPRSQFPVCCQAVSCIHEDLGNAESFLDGLQLEGQQVAFNAASFNCLKKKKKKREQGKFII